MKLLILPVVFALSTQAFAHVDPGVYRGTTPDGKPCEMKAIGTEFENGQRHPLNERVTIEYGGETFVLSHPSLIDRPAARVTFNHDLFHGVLPNASGAKAMIVEMAHTQQYEGPVAFEVIEHNWKTKASSKTRCENIKL